MRYDLLKNFEDERGHLFEAFRLTFAPFIKMAYVVSINPGMGRDFDRWHYHKKKTETFICVSGKVHIVVKYCKYSHFIYSLSSKDPAALTVYPEERHSVVNIDAKGEPAVVLVLCDQYYDLEDEYRESMDDWNWDKFRDMLYE